MLGSLYIVATPIGNLEDISFRAIQTLKEVDLILAEDTRKTGILLKQYKIATPSKSYHQHSSDTRKDEIARLLLEGKQIALVTDAGTPGISDPGNELISYLLYRLPELTIIPIPGASAVSTILSVCGLNVSKFVFLGFLPKKKLKKELDRIQNHSLPFVFFESPHRIIKSMEKIKDKLGEDSQCVMGRELTKMYEEVLRGTIEEVLEKLRTTDKRGEYVVLVVPQAQKNKNASDTNKRALGV